MISPPRNPEARQVIVSCIENSSTVPEAIKSLMRCIQSKDPGTIDGEQAWSSSLELFRVSYELARGDDALLKKLVNFVQQLKETPEVQQPTRDVDGAEEKGSTFWKQFVMASREAWDSGNDMTRDQWRDINAFFALLWKSGTLDRRMYALWCLRSELEQSPESNSKINIDASLAYLDHAGDLIFSSRETWDFNRSGDPKSGNQAALGGLLKGDASIPYGYSPARWSFWKQRLGEIAALEGVGSQTCQTAQRAVSRMDSIESLHRD